MKLFQEFITNEDGLGTIEIVVITAILLSVALLFKEQITGFAEDLMESVFGDASKYVD